MNSWRASHLFFGELPLNFQWPHLDTQKRFLPSPLYILRRELINTLINNEHASEEVCEEHRRCYKLFQCHVSTTVNASIHSKGSNSPESHLKLSNSSMVIIRRSTAAVKDTSSVELKGGKVTLMFFGQDTHCQVTRAIWKEATMPVTFIKTWNNKTWKLCLISACKATLRLPSRSNSSLTGQRHSQIQVWWKKLRIMNELTGWYTETKIRTEQYEETFSLSLSAELLKTSSKKQTICI